MTLQGPWLKYRESEAKQIKFTLEDIGLPDFWVRLKNQSVYTTIELREAWADIRKKHEAYIDEVTSRLEAKTKEVEAAIEAGEMTEEKGEEILFDVEFMDPAILSFIDRYMIVAWNLTDPYTGEILPVPSEHPQSLFQLPIEVQKFIKGQVDEALQSSVTVPKASGNS